MFCCSTKKRVRNKHKRLKSNKVVPRKNVSFKSDKDNNSINRRNAICNVDISDEKIKCGGCNEFFNLGSNELKIHCNLCNQFFHCKIAGKCQGKNCMVEIKGSKIGTVHRASYCYDCVGLISDNKILCKDCFLDEHLVNNI